MLSRLRNGGFCRDFMPKSLYATIKLLPIPYVAEYTHPIIEQCRAAREELIADDVKIKAHASDDRWIDRGEVVRAPSESYPRIIVEHGFEYWPDQLVIPAARIIMFAVKHLNCISDISIDIEGEDYEYNELQLAHYDWTYLNNVLHEDLVSQDGWHQLLDWKADRLADGYKGTGESSMVLSKRFLYNTGMRYETDYIFAVRSIRGGFQVAHDIRCIQDIKELKTSGHALHAARSMQALRDMFNTNA